MVKQERDYIYNQKKKYLTHTLIWTAAMLVVFATGIFLTKSRANYFTVVSGLMAMGLALNLTRFISFNKFRDGDKEFAQYLENMKGSLNIFHSAIIPDTRETVLFEHIIVTARSIYFLSYKSENISKNRLWIENKLTAKGIDPKTIHFVQVDSLVSIKNNVAKIEKDACMTSEKLMENTQIIQNLLM